MIIRKQRGAVRLIHAICLCSLSSISVGAVANCLPPGAVRSSLLMADIHCLPGINITASLLTYIMKSAVNKFSN